MTKLRRKLSDLHYLAEKIRITVDSRFYRFFRSQGYQSFTLACSRCLCLILVVSFAMATSSAKIYTRNEPVVIPELAMVPEVFEPEIDEPYLPFVTDLIEVYRDDMTYHDIQVTIATESTGDPAAISWAGWDSGVGLMQISIWAIIEWNAYHDLQLSQLDVYLDPELNLMVGCWLLNHYWKLLGYPVRADGSVDFDMVYVAFNAGIGNCLAGYYTHYLKGIALDNITPYTSLDLWKLRERQHDKSGMWNIIVEG